MLAKRIIPCLDIRDGKTVKGINFENVTDVGDPVELGAKYARDGADELVYLDITATHEERKLFADLVRRISMHLNIPFTVGGGIDGMEDAELLLSAGADKVSINSSAVRDPALEYGWAVIQSNTPRCNRQIGRGMCALAGDGRAGILTSCAKME